MPYRSSSARRTPRILIVEDEYIIAEDIAAALREMEVEVLGPAPTMKRALALLASEEAIDAAILDVQARDDFTFGLADRLHRERIPFVFVTGFEARDLPLRYKKAKTWTKPFDVDLVARSLLDGV